MAEITAMGRASVLLPYPYHRDQHQLANARCLVRASAARIVHDRIDPGINGPALGQALEQLLGSADQLRLRTDLRTTSKSVSPELECHRR